MASQMTFKPTQAFRKKEDKLRQSILQSTKRKLRSDLLKLFNDPQFCDVILLSHSNELPVHSFMIKARFPEFFNYIQKQPESLKVNITEVQFVELEEWVKALYSEDNVNHALIKETLDLREEKNGEQPTGENASLETDLLSLFNENTTGDVEFIVDGKAVRAHKAILAARSDYFSAMFSTSWREATQTSIKILDVSYEIFFAVLKFIYGVSQDILGFSSSKVLRFADMYNIQDLIDLIIVDLKITKCHLFHKPCTLCIPQVYECLKLCEDFYQTGNFQLECVQWISKNFQKTLACRKFSQMSDHFRNDVRQEIHKQMSPSTVVFTWLSCSNLISSLKNLNTKWTETGIKFAEELRELCLRQTVENFSTFCELPIIDSFTKQAVNSTSQLEQFLNELLEMLTSTNCCCILRSLEKLIHAVMTMDEGERHFCYPFGNGHIQIVEECIKRCERFIIGRIGIVSKTEAWKELSSSKQQELKSRAFFVDL